MCNFVPYLISNAWDKINSTFLSSSNYSLACLPVSLLTDQGLSLSFPQRSLAFSIAPPCYISWQEEANAFLATLKLLWIKLPMKGLKPEKFLFKESCSVSEKKLVIRRKSQR